MTTLVHSYCSRIVLCVDHTQFETIGALKAYLCETKGFPKDALFFICNGSIVDDNEPVKKGVVYHTYPRILGGKGGFGSMLRSIGAQIEKTTNHEALRDLSGRRMRDVNNEIALKEWLAKQADKEREREQRRQERMARRRAMPNHKFDDPVYDQQRNLLAESQEQALLEGLKRSQTAPSTSSGSECKKRKTEEPVPGSSKQRKTTEWLGIDIDNLSDLDSDEEKDPAASTTVKPDSNESENSSSGTSGDEQSSPRNDSSVCNPVTSSSENILHSNRELVIGSSEHKQLNQTESGLVENVSDKQNTLCNVENTSADSCMEQITSTQDQDSEKNKSKEEPKTGPINLETISAAGELLAYGLDPLKQELMSRGLKCGGTLEQRAERLFSVKGLSKDEIDPSLFAKNGGKNLKKKN